MLIRTAKHIYVLGDVHGEFKLLAELLAKLKSLHPEDDVIVLQCGDFGFWFYGDQKDALTKAIPEGVEIFACPGNHENWDYLDTFGYTPTQVVPGVWYMPFGTVLQLNNLNVLFVGKADSVDKDYRIPGYTWWPQEIPTFTDMDNVDDVTVPIRLVISHTCPNSISLGGHYKSAHLDPTRTALDYIWDKFRPSAWCCGHFHEFTREYIRDRSMSFIKLAAIQPIDKKTKNLFYKSINPANLHPRRYS